MRRVVLAVCLAGALAEPAAALERATVDRPDEVRGAQVHAVYAVPSDGEDRALDTSGAIASSVQRFNAWLAAQTGGPALRLDTSAGELDVTFVRLPRTDAQIAARAAFAREELEQSLRSLGLLRTDRVNAVYYDGSSTWSCGGGAWPPTIVGQVAAMYLRGTPPAAPPCASNPFPGPPGYFEFAMLHEIVHTLGFVATCAPHHTRAGHVSDANDDLMWAGDAPWVLPPRLDVGRDDYYGHGRSDCLDLARSPYLTSNAPPPSVASVTGFTMGRPRAGRPLTATLSLTVDGAVPGTATVSCVARIGNARLRARTGYADGRATCRWTIPRTAGGRRVTGFVAVTAAGTSVRRTFARAIARR